METSTAAEPGGERVARAADGATAALETAADYVRDLDLKRIFSDVPQIVKKHPAAVLLAAAALGFVLARALSRR